MAPSQNPLQEIQHPRSIPWVCYIIHCFQTSNLLHIIIIHVLWLNTSNDNVICVVCFRSNTVGVGSDDKRDGGLPSRGGKRDLQFKHSGRMTVQSEEAKYGLTAPPQSSSTATEVGEKEVKQSQEEASAATADKVYIRTLYVHCIVHGFFFPRSITPHWKVLRS